MTRVIIIIQVDRIDRQAGEGYEELEGPQYLGPDHDEPGGA